MEPGFASQLLSALLCCSDYALENKLIGPLMHTNLKLVRCVVVMLWSCSALFGALVCDVR